MHDLLETENNIGSHTPRAPGTLYLSKASEVIDTPDSSNYIRYTSGARPAFI
jgi:hypothetical protein